MVAEVLTSLQTRLYNAADTIEAIKLFLLPSVGKSSDPSLETGPTPDLAGRSLRIPGPGQGCSGASAAPLYD